MIKIESTSSNVPLFLQVWVNKRPIIVTSFLRSLSHTHLRVLIINVYNFVLICPYYYENFAKITYFHLNVYSTTSRLFLVTNYSNKNIVDTSREWVRWRITQNKNSFRCFFVWLKIYVSVFYLSAWDWKKVTSCVCVARENTRRMV